MSKRFGIDARWITRETSGIGHYTEKLIQSLSKVDTENQYFLFFSNKKILARFSESFDFEKHPNYKPVFVPYSPFSLIGLFAINRVIASYKLDLFHSTNFMIPLFASKVKLVATIHDLIPLIYPHYTPKAKKTRLYPLYALLMNWIGRRANLILADSRHSQEDIIRTLKIPEDKVKRVYIGVDEKYKPATKVTFSKKVSEQYQIKPPYFLYVGRHDPYKNIEGLVRAYSQYLKKVPDGAQLVITGNLDPRYPEAARWCEKEGLMGKVVFTNHVSDEALLTLYQHALAVVLVSKYEGFGLPVLEAMACGVPVLCSNVASLPEVADEAVVKVSPKSIEHITQGLIELHQNEKLRQECIRRGKIQAKKFSWQNCAIETWKAYEILCEEPAPSLT